MQCGWEKTSSLKLEKCSPLSMQNSRVGWSLHKNKPEVCWTVMMVSPLFFTVKISRLVIRKSSGTLISVSHRMRRKILLDLLSANKFTLNLEQMSLTSNSRSISNLLMSYLKEQRTKCWSTTFMMNTIMLLLVSWPSIPCTSYKPSGVHSTS